MDEKKKLSVHEELMSFFVCMHLFFCNAPGHLMENINAGKALHRAFSVFLFNEKHELLLQVLVYMSLMSLCRGYMI